MKRGTLALFGLAALLAALVGALARWVEGPAGVDEAGRLERSLERAAASDPSASSGGSEAAAARAARRVRADGGAANEGAPSLRAPGTGAARSEQRFVGRVVDARSEEPIEGAVVALIASGTGERSEASTDEHGSFALDVDLPAGARAHVELRSEGYTTVVRPDVDVGQERDWPLWPAAAIEGVVRVPAGAGPPVEVALWSVRGGDDEPAPTIVAIGDDGAFRFEGLRPGVYALAARAAGAAPTARGGLALGVGGAVAVELELARGARLLGRVLERATKAPIAGATVALEWTEAGLPAAIRAWLRLAVESGADGRYALEGLAAGVHEAVVSVPWGSRRTDEVDVAGSGERLERDFLVGRSASLSGIVLAPEGGAVAGARVVLFTDERAAADPVSEAVGVPGVLEVLGVAEAVSDAAGAFELVDVPPRERLALVAFPPASSELLPSEPRPLKLRDEEQRADLDVRLGAGARFAGTVEDTDGRPVVGAEIELRHRVAPGTLPPARATTDADGRFEFPPQPSGKVELTVAAEGFAPLSLKLALRADRPVDETIRLQGGTVLEGVVVDREGWGVPYARVGLKPVGPTPGGGPRRRLLETVADPLGTFRFDGVADGRWKPRAGLAGWTQTEIEPAEVVVPGTERLIVELNPEPRRSVVVRGTVVLAGAPPSGLRLEGLSGVTVVEDGEFTISGLAAGRTKLVVRAERALPRAVRLDLSSGGEVDLGVIELVHGTEVVLRLRDAQGRPLRKADVRLRPRKDPPKARRGEYGVPGTVRPKERKAGQYDAGHVVPGRWRVVVRRDGFEPVEREIRVRRRDRQVVPIDLER